MPFTDTATGARLYYDDLGSGDLQWSSTLGERALFMLRGFGLRARG